MLQSLRRVIRSVRCAVPLALAAALLLTPCPAAAWWEMGHETVATIAMGQVKPATRASIRALLKRQAVLQTPSCKAGTIEQAAIWPDCIKALGDRFSYQSPWHYQDADVCKPFDLKSACAHGNCVSSQIARAERMVADRKLPARDRLMALAYLVHFVGDLHQPLHDAEREDDQGGNKLILRYGAISRTNLHSVWDGALAERAITSLPAGAAGIISEIPADQRASLATGTIRDWSRESWELAKARTYGSILTDLCGPTPPAVALDEPAIQSLLPVVRLQIARAGLRLARLLDEALDGDHPEVAHPPKSAPEES